MKKIINKIISILNRKEYSTAVFPYIGLPFKKGVVPYRMMPAEHDEFRGGLILTKYFQSLWEKILVKEVNSAFLPIKSLGLGADLITLASRYIEKEVIDRVEISSGIITYDILPISYKISVIPGTEPYISVQFNLGLSKIELSVTKWDMSYRPENFKHMDIWSSLEIKRYEYMAGKLEEVESLDLYHGGFSFSGATFFGKEIQKNYCICEVGHDKFRNNDYSRIKKIETPGPFIKKVNEYFKLFGIEDMSMFEDR